MHLPSPFNGTLWVQQSFSFSTFRKNIERKKNGIPLGDFNADLLKYDHDDEVADFLDAMYSKLLLPNISSPTRITSTSATLIDNIFTNNYDNTFTSGNLVTTLSDHLAQILIVPIQNATRYKEPKKFTVIFRKFWGTNILFPDTYKILTGIWNSS